MEHAPNPCEAGPTPNIVARCVSVISRSLPPHHEMFCPFSEFRTFLLFQRHIFLQKHRIDVYRGGSCSDLLYGG